MVMVDDCVGLMGFDNQLYIYIYRYMVSPSFTRLRGGKTAENIGHILYDSINSVMFDL